VRLDLVEKVAALIVQSANIVTRASSAHQLLVNDRLSLSIAIARFQPRYNRWQVPFCYKHMPDITMAARMDEANNECLDYYIFPHASVGLPPTVLIYAGKKRKWNRYRYDSLESLLPIIGAYRLGLMSGSWGA
jgi:hypothetical protein